MILPPDRSLLDLQGRALVVPVNRVGVMGAGVALAVAERWPSVVRDYRSTLRYGGLKFGDVLPVPVFGGCLLLVTTKDHWRDPSRVEWVDAALDGLAQILTTSPALAPLGVHLPALGCGRGGLAWHDVKVLIDRRLGALPVNVYRYAPETPT